MDCSVKLRDERDELIAQMADQGPYINKLRDRVKALKAELGDLPQSQAYMLSEIKALLANIKADEALMRAVLTVLEAGDLLCELKAADMLNARLEMK
jgi:predicted  nucleic acid-binding Zn-ribbon protein